MKITATGPTQSIQHNGGYGSIIVVGDFNGATATVEARYPHTTQWIPQQSVLGEALTLTDSASATILTSKCEVRLNFTGVPDVNFEVYPIIISVR